MSLTTHCRTSLELTPFDGTLFLGRITPTTTTSQIEGWSLHSCILYCTTTWYNPSHQSKEVFLARHIEIVRNDIEICMWIVRRYLMKFRVSYFIDSFLHQLLCLLFNLGFHLLFHISFLSKSSTSSSLLELDS
jgi:hypothetical protein